VLGRDALDAAGLHQRHAQMLHKLGATEGRIEAAFSFCLRMHAPVSGVQGLLDCQGRWISQIAAGATSAWAEVDSPVKSLCPCSKEISDHVAHKQRALVTIRVELLQAMEWHQPVRLAKDAASSGLSPLLKRFDEKWVNEHAHESPQCVEDLVRDVALARNADALVGGYKAEVDNFESRHNHSAYACIERG
jgi:GTP cyclohydrolase I